MIAFSLPPLFYSFLHHVAAVDNSLQQLRVRVQLRIFINSSSIIFLKDLVLLVGFSSCPVFVCATIRVVVLVFSSNVPAIGLARLVFVRGLQTCRVSDFCFFRPAWYCVVILATVGREPIVFRLLQSAG